MEMQTVNVVAYETAYEVPGDAGAVIGVFITSAEGGLMNAVTIATESGRTFLARPDGSCVESEPMEVEVTVDDAMKNLWGI